MTSPLSRSEIPIVDHVEPLAHGRAAWLADVWGVMHNGVEPFAAACDACTRFRLGGGVVLLLSNAPRPAEAVAAQLDRIGVPRFAWDAIVTSGDAARAEIASLAGRPVFHLGPERDLTLYDGLDVTLADAASANAISCTGLFDDEIETPDDYAETLAEFAKRGAPMICANPDLTVERGGKLVYCAGAIAERYVALGGKASYAGKPYGPIYEMAFTTLAKIKGRPIERSETLAIGDGVNTDIKGASQARIDSLFIASGVHVSGGALDAATLTTLFPEAEGRPIAAMQALVW